MDPDIRLVGQAQKGSKKAYGKLVSRYYEMVYVLAYGVLREREASKDLTQDVFLRLFDDIKNRAAIG